MVTAVSSEFGSALPVSVRIGSVSRARARRVPAKVVVIRRSAMQPHDLVRKGRARATTIRYRASTSYLDQLAPHLTLTATSAIDTDPKLSKLFGLAGARTASLDGYLPGKNLTALVNQFFLVRDIEGNVTLRVTDDQYQKDQTASGATVALDLADSTDLRQRAAGLRAMTRMMRKL